jgi:hypothetical protein
MYKNIFSGRNLIFILITLVAIVVRFYLSFSTNLISGMDGGYYALQVRNVLNTGFLAFNDVPLYFYFCASILKLISIFGFTITNEIIIFVIKIVDSIALPLLVIPLFKILTSKENKVPFYVEIAIVLFAVFSVSSFRMLGDLQKNAFAIPFLLVFIYYIENYFITNQKRNILLAFISLFIIAMIHFGVFVFGLAFLLIALCIVYKKKAILPSLLLFFVGFTLILLFDSTRAMRLLTFWNVIFEKPAIINEPLPPPLLLNILFSYILVGFAIFQYKKHQKNNDRVIKYMVLILTILIAIFAFPFYETQYVLRFNALLFIPQSLLILNLIQMNRSYAFTFSIFLVFVPTFSIFTNFHEIRKPIIDNFAFQDLQNIKKYIPENKDSTIIITRHGIEFWTAWALNVKVGNDRGMEKIKLDNYRNVIFLQPKREFDKRPHEKKPFHEPPIPKNSQLVYSSLYFNVYQIKK